MSRVFSGFESWQVQCIRENFKLKTYSLHKYKVFMHASLEHFSEGGYRQRVYGSRMMVSGVP